MKNDVGVVIRTLRKEKKLTLQNLSEISNVSFAQIGKIERGDHHPTRETLKKLAKALQYDPKILFNLAGYTYNEEDDSIENFLINHQYEVLTKYNNTCQICGAKAPEVEVTVALINPENKIEASNLIVLCKTCNYSREKKINQDGLENDYLFNKYIKK